MATNETNSSLYRVQVLDRAFAIIDALADTREDASLAEIAAIVKMHKSTVHRLMMNLERHRLVDRDQTGHYRLGMKLYDLGIRAFSRFDIRHRARPHLEKLMYNTEETVHLCILDDGEMLYVDKVEPRRSIRMSSTVGRRNAVHCTAVGKADYKWARRHVTSHPPSAGPRPAAAPLAGTAQPGGADRRPTTLA